MKKLNIILSAICLVTVAELSSGTCPTDSSPQRTIVVQTLDNNNDNTPCPPATQASPIDTSLLSGAASRTVSWTISNNEVAVRSVIFGSEAAREGAFINFGLAASAVDANVADQFGNHLPKVQGYSSLVCNHSAIISKIEVFTDNASQRAQRWTRVKLDLDANRCTTAGRIPQSDTQLNNVEINGIFVQTDRDGLSYPVLPFATVGAVEVQFTILSEALVEAFQPGSTK